MINRENKLVRKIKTYRDDFLREGSESARTYIDSIDSGFHPIRNLIDCIEAITFVRRERYAKYWGAKSALNAIQSRQGKEYLEWNKLEAQAQ